MTILGTRPEIIRLSRVIEKLDSVCEHTLVHTGQNFDHNLDQVFFDELGVRKPDYYLGARGTFGQQIGTILAGMEKVLAGAVPDKFLVLGDTNSSLAAIMAKRLGIPVYHMEAGNRCYDDRVPEEVNRRIIDHSSDVLLPYTERSRQNLLREGIPGHRIYVTGNPIYEVLQHYRPGIDASRIHETLGLEKGKYFLVTMHRAENVDPEARLKSFVSAFQRLNENYGHPVIVSTHPRARLRLEALGMQAESHSVRYLEPFSFFDFVQLEKNAFCILSDSGTVQEECAILGIPNVTIRDVTERPETLECGSNTLTGADPNQVELSVRLVLDLHASWTPPVEYTNPGVSSTVIRILTGYLYQR
jgi:UDP-N-acetylglucosamine 2-epimerase (non-hydrolysing)